MAINKRWVNWATAVTAAVLLVFSMAQLVVSFYMNATSNINKEEKANISGSMMVSLGVLFFPTAWVGFTAAISRHRGVYIALMVLVSLSILDAIGMIVYQAYRFSVVSAYADAEMGTAITLTVLISLLLVILIFSLAFAAAALCYQCPEHRRYERKSDKYGYPMAYSQPPPVYNGGGAQYLQAGDGYRMSLPRGAWDYATEPRVAVEPRYLKARY